MLTIPILISVIYLTCFAIYLLSGILILSLNRESMKNRLFFFICLSLCIWSFGASISISASDYGQALCWERVSALGWGTLCSFVLHFILVLTTRYKLLQKWWIYLVLYLPALVNVLIYSLYSDLVVGMYNMTSTQLGWSIIPTNNIWDWYFNIYYMGFTLVGLGLLVNWSERTTDQKEKSVARLLVYSVIIALVVGTITDRIINSYLSVAYPQIAPMIILIPFVVIIYSLQYHDILKSAVKSQTSVEGNILSRHSRARLFTYLSISYVLGAMFYTISAHFVYHDSLISVLLNAGIFLCCSLIIGFVDKMPIKEDYQDYLVALLISLSIPLIYLRFLEYACLSVWAVPAVFLMLSVLFNNRRTLVILSAATLLIQVWVWIKVPTAMVQVQGSDHLNRIFVLLVLIAISFYVNHVYITRLKENEDKTNTQKMLYQISANLVTLSESNFDEIVRDTLKLSGKHYQVDRALLFAVSPGPKTIICLQEWCDSGIEPAIGMVGEVSFEDLPGGMNCVLNGEEFYIPNVDMLPSEAGEVKEQLKKQHIQSMLCIPLKSRGKVLGFLGFEAVKNAKPWREDHRESVRVLANIMADALAKLDAEKEIKHMAFYDSLTGLANRKLFVDQLKREIHLARRTVKPIGIIFIDLDYFKTINDTMGHEAGDELLKQVASRLNECVRKHDIVSRFGGDEFVIMLTNMDRADDIARIAEKIMKSFEKPLIMRGQEFFIAASAGVAIFPTDGEEGEELLKNADLAMYSSKIQGKNKYTLCSPIMKVEALEKMKLTNSLYRAQERNELVLYYQPQVELATKKIIGLEALIRWQSPEMGMIMPGTFIPLAEKTGLINPIGEWVLRTACHKSMAWQELGIPPLRMAVNMSVEQFRNPNLVNIVSTVLAETGLRPECLELEITESIAVKESDYIVRVLNTLKDLGVTIAIDDFGTEYSSLARLKLLPIDRIKIDMQFVRGISVNPKDEAIAMAIIQLARNLKHKVIAEGVETERQLDFLTYQVCDEVQGFLYYRPLPAEEIEVILLSQYGQK